MCEPGWRDGLGGPFLSSPSEINEVLHLATLSELEVIPLVQTFGHMEVSGRGGRLPGPGWGLGTPRAGGAARRGSPLPALPCPAVAGAWACQIPGPGWREHRVCSAGHAGSSVPVASRHARTSLPFRVVFSLGCVFRVTVTYFPRSRRAAGRLSGSASL